TETRQGYYVAFSPDGKLVLSGADGVGPEGEIRIWDVATGKLLRVLHDPAKTDPIKSGASWLSFSANGEFVCARCESIVKVWKVENGELVRTLDWKKWIPIPRGGARIPTDKYIGTLSGGLKFWD